MRLRPPPHWRPTVAALGLLAAVLPGLAGSQAPAPEASPPALATLWESLWHQSGVPTRVARWEGPVRWRLSGAVRPRDRAVVARALAAVSEAAGVALVEAAPDDEHPVALTVDIVGPRALEDRQPCVTTLQLRQAHTIESARVQMRQREVARCAHHEAMHVMGIRGHPSGASVLSYFPVRVDQLLPLDRLMLQTWYGPRLQPGMTPLQALPVLLDAWVAAEPDPQAAASARDAFLTQTLAEMEAYARGEGDIPAIIRRSGKATASGVRQGRSDMAYFLGRADPEGGLGGGAGVRKSGALQDRPPWTQNASTPSAAR